MYHFFKKHAAYCEKLEKWLGVTLRYNWITGRCSWSRYKSPSSYQGGYPATFPPPHGMLNGREGVIVSLQSLWRAHERVLDLNRRVSQQTPLAAGHVGEARLLDLTSMYSMQSKMYISPGRALWSGA